MSGTETTKRKKKRNSFSAALDAACRQYAQATKEREKAAARLEWLDTFMPQLRQTIMALQKQLGKEVIPTEVKKAAVTGEHRAETSADLLKLVGPQDLTGLRSIPAKTATAVSQKELTEDELLEMGDVK